MEFVGFHARFQTWATLMRACGLCRRQNTEMNGWGRIFIMIHELKCRITAMFSNNQLGVTAILIPSSIQHLVI